jgi:hypothetical protein
VPQLHRPAPGRSEYRVTLNPTGESYGVTWTAECKTREQVWQIVEWMEADAEHITTDWKISVTDDPLFGGEHSDTYLYVDATGYHGRWAEEAVARS